MSLVESLRRPGKRARSLHLPQGSLRVRTVYDHRLVFQFSTPELRVEGLGRCAAAGSGVQPKVGSTAATALMDTEKV